jgi:hypothetical protein
MPLSMFEQGARQLDRVKLAFMLLTNAAVLSMP